MVTENDPPPLHDAADDASLADLAEEYSVGRSTIHRIISAAAP